MLRTMMSRGTETRSSGHHEAEEIVLGRADSIGHAFQIIISSCLGHLTANREGACNRDSEALHQMRIGLRRLRTALSTFKGTSNNEDFWLHPLPVRRAGYFRS
jgi:inorganic triphosphatase YgiF